MIFLIVIVRIYVKKDVDLVFFIEVVFVIGLIVRGVFKFFWFVVYSGFRCYFSCLFYLLGCDFITKSEYDLFIIVVGKLNFIFNIFLFFLLLICLVSG